MEAQDGKRAGELAAAQQVIELARASIRTSMKVIEMRNDARPWTEIAAMLLSLTVAPGD